MAVGIPVHLLFTVAAQLLHIEPGHVNPLFPIRLENAGIRHLKASHYALMMHRHHDRLDWSSEKNAALYASARNNKTTYVETGLRQ
jgi:hypothetical protein